ncbi:MAG: F0F1 ATP synthase subunit B [Akkermansiaceae bacterium]|nr:F0F1 ATP synthase subunit B [Armatimonadota bacterium]
MEEIFSNLNISFPTVLVNFLGFGLLWFTASKMVFTPIGKVIEERQADIQKTYDQLDADQRQMQALKTDYEARLAAVEAEGRERITNMIKEAQVTRDSVLSDANSRAHELISRAEAEVEREKEQAMITIRTQVADLAIGAAERVIGDNLNEARSRKLVDEFIASGGGPSPDYTMRVPTPDAAPVVATAPAAAVTTAPVAEAKPAGTSAGFVAGAVAAGIAAVAAVATAVRNATEDAREKAADVAEAIGDRVETVEDTLRGIPETVVVGTEASPEVVGSAAARKPRPPRKKTDATGEVGA